MSDERINGWYWVMVGETPIACFAYRDHASRWARANYAGRHRIKREEGPWLSDSELDAIIVDKSADPTLRRLALEVATRREAGGSG